MGPGCSDGKWPPIVGMVLSPAITVPPVFSPGRPQVFGFKVESGMFPNAGMVPAPPSAAALPWSGRWQVVWPKVGTEAVLGAPLSPAPKLSGLDASE